MKATAISPANIAFIKYWGRLDHQLFLPVSTTNSMNLDACLATTTVEFNSSWKKDQVVIADDIGQERKVTPQGGQKDQNIFHTLDRMRKLAKFKGGAKVYSKLTFPVGAGIASSAAGLSALVGAGYAALGLREQKVDDPQELSREIRLSGSVSAARSSHDGFTEHLFAKNHQGAYTVQIAPPNHWDLVDLVAVVARQEKKISSALGHELADSSPFWNARLDYLSGKATKTKEAILQKDFLKLAKLAQDDTLNMHAVMMTSTPRALYFTAGTMQILKAIESWQDNEGWPVFFTIDAGANVHVITTQDFKDVIYKALSQCSMVQSILVNNPAIGLRITDHHIF